ncbi:hypothetical protein PRIPAC_76567 [Pristionchus pacificus]|uniref:Peptidase n=1 Tax=Pristionchus pacificus TaxID=54126 RepID=A0A2A6BFX0_PRIPA|nr:hypothetical protein PRIPAC_76567 [Pristionchus pacificus]|eukprot:PDM64780.1 Peptidase [Pristionchus pacificus]
MVKKRGGVPYLKTNLKFSWESATDLDNNELNEILLKLGSHLNEVGLSYNVPSDSTSKPTRKRKLSPSDSENEYGFVGLNSVFSGMSAGDAICVLFDSSSLKASAVSSVLGLYAHRRGTEAIGLTAKSSSIIELIREKLVPLSLAGKVWNTVLPGKFREGMENTTIKVMFYSRYHDDSYPFDGMGGEVAHSYFPTERRRGEIHIDADEPWGPGGRNLYWVLAHEIGHSLGIPHLPPPALMAEDYQGYVESHPRLYPNDLLELRKLYSF